MWAVLGYYAVLNGNPLRVFGTAYRSDFQGSRSTRRRKPVRKCTVYVGKVWAVTVSK
jgi:hypothetical protein